MFANDKNIDNLQQLLAELKKYAELQKDYVKLHLVEKLTILISTLILVFILLILGIIALFYLSFTLAYVMLAPHVGGLMAQLWNHYRMHYSDSVNRFIPQTADCSAYGKFPCQLAFK